MASLNTIISKAWKGSGTVTDESSVIIPEYRNPYGRGRNYALITNEGSENIWLMFGESAAVGEGIWVEKNGGAYELVEGRNNTSLAIHGITVTGAECHVSWIQA